MRLRQSDLKTWSACPLQWKFGRLDGLPREQSCALTFGSIIHEVILWMEVNRDLAGALDRFRAWWLDPASLDPSYEIQRWLPKRSFQSYATDGERILSHWWSLIEWDSDVVLAREQHFIVPIGDGHELEGTIDKLTLRYRPKTDDHVLLVSDLKTTRKAPSYNYLRQDLQFSAYCLHPETPVLMADLTWKPIGEIRVGEQVLSSDEYPVETLGGVKRRHWRTAAVENVWSVEKESYRVTLSDGRQITAGGTHRFLAHKSGGWEWRTVEDMQAVLHDSRRKQSGIRIAGVIERPEVEVDYMGQDYCAGYLAGATLGDGAIRSDADTQPFWQIGVSYEDQALLDRVSACATTFGIRLHPWHREPDGRGWQRQRVVGLRTGARLDVEALAAMDAGVSLDWRAGWLAGLYDTDGGLGRSSLTYYQKDAEVLKQVQRFADDLGFTFTVATKTARLEGDRSQVAAFCGLIRPALARKVEALDATTLRVFSDLRVEAIEALGVQTLVDITTSTGTFIADGIVSHNCYATTQESFWTGVKNGEHYFEHAKDLPREAEWVQLTGPQRKHAGERNQQDYNRLAYAVNMMAASIDLRIFVPNISGESCCFCSYRDHCGLPDLDAEGHYQPPNYGN